MRTVDIATVCESSFLWRDCAPSWHDLNPAIPLTPVGTDIPTSVDKLLTKLENKHINHVLDSEQLGLKAKSRGYGSHCRLVPYIQFE